MNGLREMFKECYISSCQSFFFNVYYYQFTDQQSNLRSNLISSAPKRVPGELFSVFLVDFGNIWFKAFIGAEIEGSCNSAFWHVGGAAITISELCRARVVKSVIDFIWGADVGALSLLVSGGAKFDGIFVILIRIA